MRNYGEIYTIRAPRFIPSKACEAIMTVEGTIDLWHVPPTASLTSCKAVHEIAVYFRTEFRYDFAGYSLEHSEPRDSAFLLTHTSDNVTNYAVGAVFFDWVQGKNYPPCHVLEWVWLHPFLRRRGHLSKIWPYFTQRFGSFHVSHPRSYAMEKMLEKVGYAEVFA